MGIGIGLRLALGGLSDFATGLTEPTLRLGVTGLSGAGKTVLITALVHALLEGASLPLLSARSGGRITKAYLRPQPDDQLPRFPYEEHIAALTGVERRWPKSTERASQLRLTVDYVTDSAIARSLHGGKLNIDIIDYPGEWLLDLPLLTMSYDAWCAKTIAAAQLPARTDLSRDWLNHLTSLDAGAPADEQDAVKAAALFTAYLKSCRSDEVSISNLPPGRFLMPGDLAGSPLLTFAPLNFNPVQTYDGLSLASLMRRRYDAYVTHVVRPFFFDHFARLDRQIVLVDVLQALNAGSDAVTDLRATLTEVLSLFRQGENTLLNKLFGRRIDKLLFVATKADQLHRSSHDRLEGILRLITDDAAGRAGATGTKISVAALASVRATREAMLEVKGEKLPCIAGIPQKGERIDGHIFDGLAEAAVFVGDLPVEPASALSGNLVDQFRAVRFRPPVTAQNHLPWIRLDRALNFLIGDRLR